MSVYGTYNISVLSYIYFRHIFLPYLFKIPFQGYDLICASIAGLIPHKPYGASTSVT